MLEHESGRTLSGGLSAGSRVTLLLAAVIALSLVGAPSAFAISRNTALARAQVWVDRGVPYSQHKYFRGYRTDCSGFASMTWKANMSYSTRSMHHVAHRIKVSELKPGDALLKYNYHIRIFYGWVDDTHQEYVTYEQTGPHTESSIKSISQDIAFGYKPYRYNKITNSPASSNLLKNPTFDVWSSDWRGVTAVWWTPAGSNRQAVRLFHRKNIHRTSRSSLQIYNPSVLSRDVVTLSQTARVTANATYTLSAWARTSGVPGAVSLTLRCLDASGAVLAERSTSGAASNLGWTSFKSMAVTAFTPTGTVKATVVLGLAGGTLATTNTAGVAAIIDDVSLARPPLPLATLTKPRAPSSARHGAKFSISGYLKPRHPAGKIAVTLKCYHYESGHWVSRKSVRAAVSNYSDYSKYAVRLSLPWKGSWRIRAYHSDSGHRASYSGYHYIRVR